MENIQISVVIPFYNARDYVTQAVESALAQPETGEVLLIEDASPDGGLEVCQKLADQYPKVRLLQHPDKANHGEPASRNLGIINASFSYIAFLDADDFFLPDRFKRTMEVFKTYEDADGVYEAIGATFQNEEIKEFWSQLPLKDITTITKVIEPEDLYENLMAGKSGYFSVDGFTVRKEILDCVGNFNEKLLFMPDTDLILKLSAKGNLYPGNIETPVSIRRVHDKNRITFHMTKKREIYQSHLKLWFEFYKWGKMNLPADREMLAVFRYMDRLRSSDYFNDFRWSDFIFSRKMMLGLIMEFPGLFFKRKFWRMVLPSRRCFNNKSREDSQHLPK